MTKKRINKKSKDSTFVAWLATFLSIFGFVIALLAKREDKYVMHYAKQSLVVFIGFILIAILDGILIFLPFIGWIAIVIL
jgi:uncharacterized membrane protein